ncbi:MAG: SprT-like domain-containing protein [bacterium]
MNDKGTELKDLALTELARFSKQAPCKKGVPTLVWNYRMRTTAGRYFVSTHLIELNPHLLTDEQRVKVTLAHEYAHAVASCRAKGESSHGPTWHTVMAEIGIAAKVRHSFDASALRRPSRWLKEYECPVCLHRWHVRRLYTANCYHPCATNTKHVKLRLVGVKEATADKACNDSIGET